VSSSPIDLDVQHRQLKLFPFHGYHQAILISWLFENERLLFKSKTASTCCYFMQPVSSPKTTADMRFQITVSVFSVCLAMANLSWSLEAGQKFHRVETDNGEVLCGMSPTNATLNGVRSPLECVSLCRQGCASLCQSVNYRKNAKLCEQFDYRPCYYAVQPDCANYQYQEHSKLLLWVIFTTVLYASM